MPFNPSIQSLTGAHSGGDNAGVDWTRRVMYQFTGSFLSRYGLFSGLEENFVSATDFGGSGSDITTTPLIGFSTVDGHLMMSASNSLYSGAVVTINQSALSLLNFLPYPSPNFGEGGTTGVTVGNSQFFIDQGIGNGIIGVLNRVQYTDDGTTFLGEQDFAGAGGVTCAGPVGTGKAYILSPAPSGSPFVVKLQEATFNAVAWVSTTTTFSYLPTDIDAGWATSGAFSQFNCGGVCLDKTDGKLICMFHGSGGSANGYLVKINQVSGAIDWKTPLPTKAGGGPVVPGQLFAHSDIRHQRIGFYTGSPNTATIYNTATGAVDTTYTAGLSGMNPNLDDLAYSDTLGALILNTSFTDGADVPTRLNATPASFSGWAVLYLAAPIAPPPPISLGNAYMIERMDNRIWPAAEDVWCVDCALQTELATPDSILYANSATGAGIPLSVTITVAGQGYSAGTTARIQDPTGFGAAIALTIASGMITGAVVVGGVDYTYPTVIFEDPAQTGVGAEATVVLDNTVLFQSQTPAFDVSMVGSVIRMGGGKATITAYTDDENVTGNMTTPITAIIPNSKTAALPNGLPAFAPSGEWSVAPMITTVTGLWHLIGFTVTGTADGAVISPQVVTDDGTITLPAPASLITIGLPFTPQFQSLYLDGGSPTIQGQRKKVAAVTIRLDASGVDGIVGGSNQPDGAAQNPPVIDMTWTGMTAFELRPDEGLPPYGGTVAPLYTGDVRQPIMGGFDRPGQVALQQNMPLPMNVLAIVPEFLEGDTPEQTYSPEPPKGRGRGSNEH